MPPKRRLLGVKLAVSLLAIAGLLIRIIYPGLNIDAVALGFLVIAVLPWFSDLIKSVEIPGFGKVELRDLQDAEGKIIPKASVSLKYLVPDEAPPPKHEAQPDSALVGLRISIEEKLRVLAEKNSISPNGSLEKLAFDLRQIGVLSHGQYTGLNELITSGNIAVHGGKVSPEAEHWARKIGPVILAVLGQLAEKKPEA